MNIKKIINESIIEKEMVLVDNSESIDIKNAHLYDTHIRPKIKNEMCKLIRTIERSPAPRLYVVKYKGEEVYLNRDEFEWVE